MRRLLAALVLALPLAGLLAGAAAAVTLHGRVTRVVDGDTIRVAVRGFETPVRLIGIDTPETVRPGTPVQCFGPAASARTASLLPVGRQVVLVTDPTQSVRDRYARLVAYVYTPGHRGPRGSANYSLVASGHARVSVYGGVRFRHAVPFFRAQHRARRARRGLWGPPCDGDTTKPDPSVAGSASAHAGASGACDPNYAGACVPPAPPDHDCRQIAARGFRVVGADDQHLDGDHDGIACER